MQAIQLLKTYSRASVVALALFVYPAFLQAEKQLHAEPSTIAHQSLLLDITSNNKELFAVGMRGHIIRSADCGRQWQQVIAPTRMTLNGIRFYNNKLGWAVGHDSIILKTSDGGNSWQKVYEDIKAEQPLFDILFLDEQHGFAIGAYGALLETTDGGQNWSNKPIYGEDDFHLYAISRSGDNELIVSGEAGSVYLSTDQGKAWHKLKSPYEGTFFGNLVMNSKILVFGMRGNLFSTDDLGQNWVKLESNTHAALETAIVLQDQSVLVAGGAGVLLSSDAQAKQFSPRQNSGKHHQAAIVQCHDGSILSVGNKGVKKVPAWTN